MSTFVVRVDKDQEILETIQAAVAGRGVINAVMTLIGAVQECTVSVMPERDPLDDIITDYDQPFEFTGTGEVTEGKIHVHGVFAGDGVTVAGHVHKAVVQDWFVRCYVTPIEL